MGRYLIYGGTGGMGSAIARRLAAAGHDLHLVARQSGPLEGLAGELGATCTAVDVREPGFADVVVRDLGDAPLAGLVYAVGTINLKPLGRLSDDDFIGDFTVNALGAARAVRAALPLLGRAPDGASVLMFSSVAARQGFAAHASVAMAKAAVEGLVISLAAELAPKIRVNAIAPSLTATPLAAAMTGNDAMAKAIAGLHAIPRLGSPADIAPLAELLLTDPGAWITGQVIGIDGGRSTLRTKG